MRRVRRDGRGLGVHDRFPAAKILLPGYSPAARAPTILSRARAPGERRPPRLDDGVSLRYLDIGLDLLSPDGSFRRRNGRLHSSPSRLSALADAMDLCCASSVEIGT